VANVIEEVQRPTLVLAHNKTLAAQLYLNSNNSFQTMRWNILFLITITINPKPSCLLRSFIEKDLSINEELENANVNNGFAASGRRDI
jgi:excinuclease ABC subunit B